jgi:putative ABC transport system ATP-binding protein
MMALEAIEHRLVEGGSSRLLLGNFSAQFAPGCFTCLTGPSGTGKTTILSLLAGVVVPHAGQVLDGSTNVGVLDERGRAAWRRARVGLVFQTCRLIDVLTAAEHMQLVARLRGQPSAETRGLALLERLGLADKAQARPRQLSGGEKQRVALAQALASCPPILLADEPTAALDRDNALMVAAALRAHAEDTGAVVVAVSHDAAMIDGAHARVVLQK